MDALAERYLLFALRLGRRVDGLVDAYYGPAELAVRVEAEPPTETGDLADEAASLLQAVEQGELDESRRRWLSAQLRACAAVTRMLAGDEIRWSDLVERLYGVRPALVTDDELEAAHRRADAALPGTGLLRERYAAWLGTQVVPRDLILAAAERLCELLRVRARELTRLPDGERYELELVEGEPWGAYNYYLGGYRSRVVVNVDLPMWSPSLTDIVSHELYPGHHTEAAAKEAELVDRRGWAEASVLLVLAPQALLSEGIATLALEVALGADAHAVAADALRPLGLTYDHATATALREPLRVVRAAGVNAAFQIHEQGRSREEAREYLLRWGLSPPEVVDKYLEFATHPIWRAYVATYVDGLRLCRSFVDGDERRFGRLLTEPLVPSQLV